MSSGSRLCLVSVVSISFMLLVCGGLFAAEGASAPNSSAPGLPSGIHKAVEKTLVASLSLDSGVRSAWRGAYRASCRELNTHDPLLAAYRQVCLDSAAIYDAQAANEACGELSPTNVNQLTQPQINNRCQARADDKMAAANGWLVSAFRKLDSVLVGDHLSKPCRASFGGTPAALTYYTKMVPVLRLMATSLANDEPQKTSTAEDRAQQLEAQYLFPTNHQQLSEFNRSC
jgi:hypothetical protein